MNRKKKVLKLNSEKKNVQIYGFWFFVVLLIVIFIISSIPGLLGRAFEDSELPTILVVFFGIISLLFWVIQIFISIGVIMIAIKFVRGEKPSLKELYKGGSKFINYIASAILYGLIAMFGFILLIIPGIIFWIRLWLMHLLSIQRFVEHSKLLLHI